MVWFRTIEEAELRHVKTRRRGPPPGSAELVEAGGDASRRVAELVDQLFNVTRRTTLVHHRDGWRTTLKAPASATFVSLRATASDGDGNAVSQTITRAFGLR